MQGSRLACCINLQWSLSQRERERGSWGERCTAEHTPKLTINSKQQHERVCVWQRQDVTAESVKLKYRGENGQRAIQQPKETGQLKDFAQLLRMEGTQSC